MERTRQSLEEEWIYLTDINNLEVWYRETGFEDNIQYIKWNPTTQEDLGLETITLGQLQLFRRLAEDLSLKSVYNMKEMKMILMREGLTPSMDITKEMILNSLDSFINKPIIFNNKQTLKDYIDNEIVFKFNLDYCVGIIKSVEYNPKGYVEGKVIYYNMSHIKNEFDDWQIELSEDSKSFNYCSCEIL